MPSANASLIRDQWTIYVAATEGAAAVGDLRQMRNGQAGVLLGTVAVGNGDPSSWTTKGQYTLPKSAGYVLLDGVAAYWDRSTGVVAYKRNGDQDFYVGRVVGDAASGDLSCAVNLNIDPPFDFDLARDPFVCAPVGTQAVGGFLAAQMFGGAVKLKLSSTNEAQKVDALGYEGAVAAANAVVEMLVNVVSGGSGSAPDFNVGYASGTHATDFDSITEAVAMHIDGNATAIKFQSKDGTHTTAAADSLQTFTAGTPFLVWFDMRTPADVKIYVNAVRVLSGTTFDMSASTSPLKLIAHLEKTAAADTFEADVYFLRARLSEQ